MAAVLEFLGGARAPFAIDRNELLIGSGAGCALRLEGAAAAEHLRLTVDGSGVVHVQDLDTQTGTLRNGNFVYGVQELEDGDELDVGGVKLVYRRQASVAPARAGADDRTRLPTELPPEVRAALAARDAAAAAAPAGIVVGKPQPEPANFRTVQMSAPDLAALGIDPSTLPPMAAPHPLVAAPPPQANAPIAPVGPRPVVAPAAPVSAKRTMIGMPVVKLPVSTPMTPSAPPAATGMPPREEWTPSPQVAPSPQV
ncbi:MAG TPA: FHA domain-containing protein, partial [Polyangia bacterium]|nr:FHA domain-containing protein [Polyangia bacterium]